jgi:hypothetical protein
MDTPLVVIEFPAHRNEASLRSVTMTMVSSHRSAFAAACRVNSTAS